MLEPDHPLRAIIMRWKIHLPADATTDKAADAAIRQIIINLETGLFDRLPEIVQAAVRQFAGELHQNLDPVLVAIAHHVGEGQEADPQLLGSFELRLQRYHQVSSAEDPPANVITFDPP
jgi:hypothetical protein